MIYTSYFANVKKNHEAINYCVAITLSSTFWNGDFCFELAPTHKILHWWKSLTEEQRNEPKQQAIYERLYRRDVLAFLNVHNLYKRLDGKILLCYEKSSSFCHRHIVAKWFKENGYECEELEIV